jgi:hypothetical protein
MYLEQLKEYLKHETEEALARDIVPGSEPAWLVLERISQDRVPLTTHAMIHQIVPDPIPWVRGAVGDIRVLERDTDGTTFAVCYPANSEEMLKALKSSGELPKRDMRIAYHVKARVVSRWKIEFQISNTRSFHGKVHSAEGQSLSAAAHQMWDKVVDFKDIRPTMAWEYDEAIRENSVLEELGWKMFNISANPFIWIVSFVIIYKTYQIVINGLLTHNAYWGLVAWPAGASLLYSLIRLVGAILIRLFRKG